MTISHHHYMSQALQLSERGRFTVSPNPMVGCLIVKDDYIVGEGFHQKAGGPHAEIFALQQAGVKAQAATAYVTLEPCCHQGRTPPCTQALIHAGIKQVYVACKDPNPLIAGKGISALRAAGIDVQVGIMETKAQQLNEIFFHYIQHKQPFVIAKWAMSLDGKTITQHFDTKTISCQASQRSSHQTRLQVDAILIGANTAIHDDPLLTARYNNAMISKQPLRIILSSQGPLPIHLKLFDPSSPAKTIVATTEAVDPDWLHIMQTKSIEVLILPKNKEGKVHLPSLLRELGRKEITSVLVEGGMTVHEAFFQEKLVNKIHVYLAPVIIGALEKKQHLSNLQLTEIESDFYFTADYKEPTHV